MVPILFGFADACFPVLHEMSEHGLLPPAAGHPSPCAPMWFASRTRYVCFVDCGFDFWSNLEPTGS